MVKPTRPVAGYIRVSRRGDRDDERLRSPDYQHQAIERFANGEGLEVQWFAPEIDVSGSKPQRRILDEIIRQVESGQLGGIVVAKLDRLSRLRPRDRVLLFEAIEDAGGVVLSASEQIDPSTPEGRFARDVFLGVARMQWEKYREGFETAKEGAIASGIAVQNRPAVGYRKRADRRIEPDPKTAPIVREAFERRARGEGPSALARFLESQRVRTSQGSKTWSKQAVYGMVSNPIYKGLLRYGRDDRFVNTASHEPIVSEALWAAAQKPNGHHPAPLRSAESTWLLSGLLRCSACRYAMQGTKTSRGKRIYRCTRTHSGGVCPAPARIDADPIEELAVEEFWLAMRQARGKGHRDVSGRVHELELDLERAERVLGALLAPEMLAVVADLPDYAARVADARQVRDAAAEALGREQAQVAPERLLPVATLRDAWESMTIPERRDLLGQHFDCLALSRERRLVTFPAGLGPTDLPRRGFTRVPELVGFDTDVPAGARVLALKPAREPIRDRSA
jgi:DNA invertase Pin-like site-specific DNA recombinase